MNIALKLQAQKAPNMLSSHRCWALDAMMMNFFRRFFSLLHTRRSSLACLSASHDFYYFRLRSSREFCSPAVSPVVAVLQRRAQGWLVGAAARRKSANKSPSVCAKTISSSSMNNGREVPRFVIVIVFRHFTPLERIPTGV